MRARSLPATGPARALSPPARAPSARRARASSTRRDHAAAPPPGPARSNFARREPSADRPTRRHGVHRTCNRVLRRHRAGSGGDVGPHPPPPAPRPAAARHRRVRRVVHHAAVVLVDETRFPDVRERQLGRLHDEREVSRAELLRSGPSVACPRRRPWSAVVREARRAASTPPPGMSPSRGPVLRRCIALVDDHRRRAHRLGRGLRRTRATGQRRRGGKGQRELRARPAGRVTVQVIRVENILQVLLEAAPVENRSDPAANIGVLRSPNSQTGPSSPGPAVAALKGCVVGCVVAALWLQAKPAAIGKARSKDKTLCSRRLLRIGLHLPAPGCSLRFYEVHAVVRASRVIAMSCGWLSAMLAALTRQNRRLCGAPRCSSCRSSPSRPQAPTQLVDEIAERPAVRHAAFDALGTSLPRSFTLPCRAVGPSRRHGAHGAMPRYVL